MRISFSSRPPLSSPSRATPRSLGREQTVALEEEIQSLLQKGAIRRCPRRAAGFYSTMFVTPKKGGSWRPIINLRSLNRYVITPHFKMETIQNLKDVLRQGDFMAKIDLKDAYQAVPIHEPDRKYLRFVWKGETFEFSTLPFGLASAPLVFTKLLKPVVAFLRQMGIRIMIYLDDILIMAPSPEEVSRNLQLVIQILTHLGFVINQKKCILTPTQWIEFLGFVVDSVRMVLSLPQDKVSKIRKECRHMANQSEVSGRSLAHLIGLLTSCLPAVLTAPLHYRGLQALRTKTLRYNNLDYDRKVPLSPQASADLSWWVENVSPEMCRPILPPSASLNLETDASTQGWGALCRESSQRTGGAWTSVEATHHINWLELMAAFLAVRCFAKDKSKIHIQLFMDSKVAIAYVNRLGGTHSRGLCSLALEFWEWCTQRKITLHAVHIPGRANVTADWESRHNTDYSDWRLDRGTFKEIQRRLGPFSVDLFASYQNTQLEMFFSWRPDPAAAAVDALSQQWSDLRPYMFPPFALIGRCLHKVRSDGVDQAVLIAPLWPAQAWFPTLMSMLSHHPVLLPSQRNLLTDCQGQNHPLIIQGRLTLVAWPVSGIDSRTKEFLQRLPRSSVPLGETVHPEPTNPLGKDGLIGAVNGRLIRAQPLSATL